MPAQVADELLAMRASGALKISHHLHLRAEICSHSLIEELAEFGPEDRIGIVSPHGPHARAAAIRRYRPVCDLHEGQARPVNEVTFDEHVATRQALGKRVRDTHEMAAVEAAQRFGAVLASHDDTTLGHVARSAAHGIALAEFPTTEEAARACRQHGIAVMMGAPNLIRGGSHSGNVSAGDLARADLLDVVSSDYVPSALLYSAVRLAEIWGDWPRAMATVSSRARACRGA
jgi:alpha-D-ribose 1-methylphosphonate 5-triphosphate diphosphatase